MVHIKGGNAQILAEYKNTESGKNTPRSQGSAEANVHKASELLGRSEIARIQNIEYLVEKS